MWFMTRQRESQKLAFSEPETQKGEVHYGGANNSNLQPLSESSLEDP